MADPERRRRSLIQMIQHLIRNLNTEAQLKDEQFYYNNTLLTVLEPERLSKTYKLSPRRNALYTAIYKTCNENAVLLYEMNEKIIGNHGMEIKEFNKIFELWLRKYKAHFFSLQQNFHDLQAVRAKSSFFPSDWKCEKNLIKIVIAPLHSRLHNMSIFVRMFENYLKNSKKDIATLEAAQVKAEEQEEEDEDDEMAEDEDEEDDEVEFDEGQLVDEEREDDDDDEEEEGEDEEEEDEEDDEMDEDN